MARITVEDCLKKVDSRFELVILAARRAKMLMRGAKALVETSNRPIVSALREVAGGKVKFIDPKEKENRKNFPLAHHDRQLPRSSRPACDGRKGTPGNHISFLGTSPCTTTVQARPVFGKLQTRS